MNGSQGSIHDWKLAFKIFVIVILQLEFWQIIWKKWRKRVKTAYVIEDCSGRRLRLWHLNYLWTILRRFEVLTATITTDSRTNACRHMLGIVLSRMRLTSFSKGKYSSSGGWNSCPSVVNHLQPSRQIRVHFARSDQLKPTRFWRCKDVEKLATSFVSVQNIIW
jgi:hypothetical protein